MQKPTSGVFKLTWCPGDVCDWIRGSMTPMYADFLRKIFVLLFVTICESKMASEERVGHSQGGRVSPFLRIAKVRPKN